MASTAMLLFINMQNIYKHRGSHGCHVVTCQDTEFINTEVYNTCRYVYDLSVHRLCLTILVL